MKNKRMNRGWILLLAMLIFASTSFQGIVTSASAAAVILSRACKIAEFNWRNESVTWNRFSKLDGYYWTTSHHWNWNFQTRRWEKIDLARSGWSGLGIANSDFLSNYRAMASHNFERLSYPGVVGVHYVWNANIRTYQLVNSTDTVRNQRGVSQAINSCNLDEW